MGEPERSTRRGQERDRQLLGGRERRAGIDVDRIGREFAEGFDAVSAIDRPAVSIFGSARLGGFGSSHWRPLLEWIDRALEDHGMVSPDDLELVTVKRPGDRGDIRDRLLRASVLAPRERALEG